MTEQEKPSFFDALEPTSQRDASGTSTPETPAPETKTDIDFSFFDEPQAPAAPAEEPENKPDLDFSFFDEPAAPPASSGESAGQELVSTFSGSHETSPFEVEQNSVDSAFSFLDDAAPAQAEVPPEKDSGEEGAMFRFDEELHPESGGVPPVVAVTGETAGDQVAVQQQGPRTMAFTCPKCATSVSRLFPDEPFDRSQETCRQCSASLAIVRESSAQRAHRRTGELYCSTCGSRLDHQVHCHACGQFCPDYYLVQDPREEQRKARESRSNNLKIALANLKSSLISRKDKQVEELQHLQQAHATAGTTKRPGVKRLIVLAVVAALLIAAGVAATLVYRHKQEKQYVAAYVKAIYVLYTGTEIVRTSLNKTATDWKTATENGRSYAPKPDSDANIKLTKINGEADKLVQQLQEGVPAKYEKAHANLMALKAELSTSQIAVTTPPQSFDQLTRKLETMDKSVKQKVQEVKSGLSSEMSVELEAARKRYRGLATF